MKWREAASLILVGQSAAKSASGHEHKILMLQRSSKNVFAPNMYVFPGGHISTSDESTRWTSLFSNLSGGKDLRTVCSALIKARNPWPPMLETPAPIPRGISMRITAIRETFEESGVLLARTAQELDMKLPRSAIYCLPDADSWRKAVHDDDAKFIDLCEEHRIMPDLWGLTEWANWLTPVEEKVRRFDTMFYIAATSSTPEAIEDAGENTKAKWYSSQETLALSHNGAIKIMPPQLYELSILQQLKSMQDIDDYLAKKKELGVVRFMPVLKSSNEGLLFVYPGDDLYPKDIDYEKGVGVEHFDESFQEIKNRTKNHNRGERNAETRKLVMSVTVPRVEGEIVPDTTFTASHL